MRTLLTRADFTGEYNSIKWAHEEHLRIPDEGRYHSAVLIGNEDSPEAIEFYTRAMPTVTDEVAYRWVPGDPDSLRYVYLNGYTLQMWDSGKVNRTGKTRIRYEFRTPSGVILFAGDDFCCSPMHAIDSDESVRHLLGFLTLRPGDTDPDYFADYTEEQMKFARTDAESISMWSPEEYPALPISNLDGRRP
jgi:hypothetical protein